MTPAQLYDEFPSKVKVKVSSGHWPPNFALVKLAVVIQFSLAILV